jgi:inner membrane protein
MDSITHIALGACMGEAFLGKKLGKKAMLWGAVTHSMPDIDFVASFWLDPASNLLAHRGFTHSILFCGVITLVFTFSALRLHRSFQIPAGKWLIFFGVLTCSHIFIDAFNGYGVGWFEPFSHIRISFNAIYIVDPFFSIWPVIACIILLFRGKEDMGRRKYWGIGLGLSGLYLLYCLFDKVKIDRDIGNMLEKQQISYTRYFTTPAPVQNWLWFIVAGNDKGYYVGFYSLFDRKKEINLEYFPRNDSLLKTVRDQMELQRLILFSKQFYTVEKWGDSLVFNDLRFGQIKGWQDPRGKFVFHFFLNQKAGNKMVVQRGRFEGWNRETAASFLKRVIGN